MILQLRNSFLRQQMIKLPWIFKKKDTNPAEADKNQPAEEEIKLVDDGNMVLRTDNLVKKYRHRIVVNHVSINVKQGEIVGLLGPNGAGKTTTFYMTTGLITPNEGRIYLNDYEITKYPVYKRAQYGIGYLAQEPSVFRKLSVENNIRCILEMTNTSPEYQREKLESLIEEFHLQHVRKNLGDQLSGGERRRTEIARCLAINPKFIMLDEPFAGVDPIAVEDIQNVVYKLKEKNIGILITDHNAPETLSITDRAYLLFEGKILFQGSSEELSDTPVARQTGARKSPMLNIMAGLQQPPHGTVSMPKEIVVGYLPQQMVLADTKTLKEEVSEAFDYLHKLNAEIEEVNTELAECTDYESESYQRLIDRLTHLNELVAMHGSEHCEAEA